MVGLLLAWVLVLLMLTTSRTQGGEGREGRDRNWMGFSSREARLAGRVREGEARIQWLTLQLENTHKKLARVGSTCPCYFADIAIAGCGKELSVGL